MAPIWVGFWAQNSLNKGSFFGRSSLEIGWFSRDWQKIFKMGSSPPKSIIKVGMTAGFGN